MTFVFQNYMIMMKSMFILTTSKISLIRNQNYQKKQKTKQKNPQIIRKLVRQLHSDKDSDIDNCEPLTKCIKFEKN